ncbi:MAG: SH3 domain-containing protein [Lentisphaerae bacterium]|jgi:hypothetical protein|nr:SH3 domain-containing protein [Lentisphaerota bacterium]
MRHLTLICLALALAAMRVQAAEYNYRASVKHGHVSLHPLPDKTSEVVATLPFGAVLTILAEHPDDNPQWLQVAPPDEFTLWVYADLIRNSVVLANNVQARCGAGIKHKPLATLQRGDKVEIRGRLGDWIRIKAPPGTILWVARCEVEPISPQTVTTATTDQTVEEPTLPPLSGDHTPRLPPGLARFTLTAARGQGVLTLRQGRVDWPSFWESGTPVECPYTLVDASGTATALLVDNSKDKTLQPGISVMITGTLWHLDTIRLPVLVANEVKIR